ncbi:MAG: WD40/YVTN/BNR-like repeat-containing protein [Gemmatimonadales bacterium]
MSRVRSVVIVLLVGLTAPLTAQLRTPLDSASIAGLRWRNIGPANTMGRVSDIAGIPSPSRTFFVAAAGGGIWKTTNGGVTFRSVFEHEPVVSMGMLAIAPSDTMQVWAGSGEPNSRNTILPGGGIFKSTDGGITWKLMGLEKTQAIGRIVVHPTNPNIVWVAALGAPWNSNPERGLYKTTDGGQTWKLSKFVSNKAGFVDVAIDPSNPDILFASSWERLRGPYFLNSGGPGSALWKTTNGGDTWTEVKGSGFPSTMKGRIGLAIAPSNPQIVYALVEADSNPNPKGKPGVGRPQQLQSGLYRSEDGGSTWSKMNGNDTRPFYYSQVRVDPKDPNRVYWSSTPIDVSNDGGKTIGTTTIGVHVDHHAMWIDPNDPNRIVVGDDGGVSESFDRGGNWLVLNSLPISQVYDVSYDYAIPYNVCGGLQDNGAWCGPSRRRNGAITNSMWYTITGGDGFYTAQDPTDPNIVYGESQGGGIERVNVATGESSGLQKPSARARNAAWEDSIAVIEDDSAHATTSAAKKRIAEIRATIAEDSTNFALRYNWETPYFLSPHNPRVLYVGGNRVLKSVDRGDSLYPISPDLSYNDTIKVRVSMRTTGGITNDATGAETYATVVSLAESYRRPGLLYAGTDDCRVWLTRNDGGAWEELTGRFPGVPAGTYVSRIEPSYADTNTFYVSFDNHRTGDYAPYLYVTHDYGKTFRSIVNNLPTGGPDYVHVIREDPANPDVLFAGTDMGCYVSLDRGTTWQHFMTGMPNVPVFDLKIQPRDRELIAATHGRSIWIVDINPLSQITDSNVTAAVTLFKPTTAYQFGQPLFDGQSVGQGITFRGTSEPYGAKIEYRVRGSNGGGTASILIQDAAGDTVRTLTGPAKDGIQTVTWTGFQKNPPPPDRALSPAQRRDSINLAKRTDFVFDSLHKAGTDSAALARVHHLIDEQRQGGGRGNFGFGGRGRGANPEVWVERPGENFGAGGRGGGGGRGRGGFAAAGADSTLMETVTRLIEPPGGPRRGGFGFGGRGAVAGPGDYLVTVKVGDHVEKTLLRVERASGEGDADASGVEQEPGGDPGLNDPIGLVQPRAAKPASLLTLVAVAHRR